MSAAEALKAARAAGVCVSVDGDDLLLEAPAPSPSAVLDLLARHKAGIIALLHLADEGWSAHASEDGGMVNGRDETLIRAR
jgi:hypothetical protein